MCTTNARVMDGSKNHKQLYYRIPTAEFLSLLRRGSSVRIASESLIKKELVFELTLFLCSKTANFISQIQLIKAPISLSKQSLHPSS